MNSAKKEILKLYKDYWSIYFKREEGIKEKILSFYHPQITAFGTGKDEIAGSVEVIKEFLDREFEEVTASLKVIFLWQNAVVHNSTAIASGEVEIIIDPVKNVRMAVRNSLVFHKNAGGWKMVHLHGSLPAAGQADNESFPIDALRTQNEKLEKEVAEQTENLLQKNRELEIEASLERVRTVAMAMRVRKDMLDVCKTISVQLENLGVNDIRNVQTAIINKAKGTYLNYQYFSAYDIKIFEETEFNKYHTAFELAETMQKSTDAFFSGCMQGDELEKFREWRKTDNQFPDPLLDETSAVYYNFYSIGQGGLGLTTYAELPDADLEVFKRFHKVFTLAYRRFLDIEKAEAQAREAQIESSMERVRSLALGMRLSDEVGNVTDSLFAELNKLTANILACSIVVIDKEKDLMELWRARTISIIKPFERTSFEHSMKILKKYMPDWYAKFIKGINNKQGEITDEISDKTRYQFLSAIAEEYNYSKSEKQKLLNNMPEKFYSNFLFTKLGYLALITEDKFSEENLSIARRFIDLFDFAYTRFLDIQKAEAQAREAKTEAALERVRAKTLAMHSSGELAETAAEVFSQLNKLGIEPNRIYICIIKDKNGSCEFWITNEDGGKASSGFTANLNENGSFKKMLNGWQKGKKSITIDMQGTELADYFKHLTNLGVPFRGGLSQKRRMQYIAYFSQGFIGVASPDKTKPETLQLLERFAAVFNLTYTRFNDLLQAEAQNKIIQAENERKTRELEEARKMQLSMLPKEIPQLENLEIAVYMKTATEVGGDYYDFSTREDGSFNFALGDATGHGLKAGILVSAMKSIFTTNSSKMELDEFFITANSGIKSMNLQRMMMGFTMLNLQNGRFQMINAGMPPVFVYRKQNATVEEIREHGIPVGAMKNAKFNTVNTMLSEGDVVLLLTDGLPELKNYSTKELFGYQRVVNMFKAHAEKPMNEIIDIFKNEGSAWINHSEPEDDVTFVVIKAK